MKVDTLAAPDAPKTMTYFLVPGVEGVSTGDLQYREFAKQTRRALRFRGYAAVDEASEADVVILLSYGIGEPRVEYDVISNPVYDLVPSGNSTTVANSTTAFGRTTTIATTSQDRKLGVVGTSTHTTRLVEYDRFLRLAAVSAEHYRETGEVEEVWRTTVTSSGRSDDLRRVFPVMLAGAMRRIGVDTHGKQAVEVPENHPRVLFVTGVISAETLRTSEAAR